MSDLVNQHREILHKFFDSANHCAGDWGIFEQAVRELTTQNYLCHDPGFPGQVKNLEEWLKDAKPGFKNLKDLKMTLLDCIGEQDKLASRVMIEWVDAATQAQQKSYGIFFSRFEGEKIAEEWQMYVPIP